MLKQICPLLAAFSGFEGGIHWSPSDLELDLVSDEWNWHRVGNLGGGLRLSPADMCIVWQGHVIGASHRHQNFSNMSWVRGIGLP